MKRLVIPLGLVAGILVIVLEEAKIATGASDEPILGWL
jgi:hypothetical protein